MGVTLRRKCNAGTVFLNEKGMLLDMFCMWLVRNGLANLLSIPCLEHDRYQVTYDTNTCWQVNRNTLIRVLGSCAKKLKGGHFGHAFTSLRAKLIRTFAQSKTEAGIEP